MSVLISVILPVYNTSDSLDRCIRSVMGQTMKSIELVVVDDGSTDGSGEIVDAYASQDDRVCVIHQENAGVVVARNKGLAAAKGEYIAFIDSDDYADERLYEILYNAMQESEADVVSCSMHRVWKNKTVLVESEDRIVNMNETPRAPIINKCIFGSYRFRMSIWGKLYKKSLLDTYGIWYWGSRMGDSLFNIKVLMVADKIQILSTPLYYYHKRPGSITTTVVSDPLYPIRHVSMIKQIQDFGIKYGILDRIDEMLPQYYLRFLKSALSTAEQGSKYKYIYYVFKKLYAEDENFKNLLSRIRASKEHAKTVRGRMRAFYRRLFAWTCTKKWLRVAAFLYWRQYKPWEPSNMH